MQEEMQKHTESRKRAEIKGDEVVAIGGQSDGNVSVYTSGYEINDEL